PILILLSRQIYDFFPGFKSLWQEDNQGFANRTTASSGHRGGLSQNCVLRHKRQAIRNRNNRGFALRSHIRRNRCQQHKYQSIAH
ncbi:hypothetical protein, partial [uncultured Alistipes sp.]|uniref:hypothetical protein n=1 Tax=uncultured Alistipes sp. TaxID=538949 RepID=UPI002588DB7F